MVYTNHTLFSIKCVYVNVRVDQKQKERKQLLLFPIDKANKRIFTERCMHVWQIVKSVKVFVTDLDVNKTSNHTD